MVASPRRNSPQFIMWSRGSGRINLHSLRRLLCHISTPRWKRGSFDNVLAYTQYSQPLHWLSVFHLGRGLHAITGTRLGFGGLLESMAFPGGVIRDTLGYAC